MKAASKFLGYLGIGAVGVVGFILLVGVLFVISTAFTAFVVALIWNWCSLHSLFHASTLTFWQVVGVAAGINIIRGILSTRVSVDRS